MANVAALNRQCGNYTLASGAGSPSTLGYVPLQRDVIEPVDVFHFSILFLIEQSASFCHRGFWLLGWRPSKGALDAWCKDRKKLQLGGQLESSSLFSVLTNGLHQTDDAVE